MNSYNINIEKLCKHCGIGDLIAEPVPISGGLLHKMFDVHTFAGRFAVKALNPNIMQRAGAASNYVSSEKIANYLSEKTLVSCTNYYNSFLQNADGQFYLVYDFIDGKVLSLSEIKPEHSYQIGASLAKIHSTDFSKLNLLNDRSNSCANNEKRCIDWDLYMQKGAEIGIEWCENLRNNLDDLYSLTEKAYEAAEELCGDKIISHCDLDHKNVLWQGLSPIIIDWESAGYVNIYRDFFDTALYWSVNSDNSFMKDCFTAFFDGYKQKKTLGKFNTETVLYSGLINKLEWLEYSLKRSLGIECADGAERRLGTTQVTATIIDINSYVKNFDEIIGCVDDLSK